MTEIEKLESINVGIVGHIDHGKTTILKQLTGRWTDTHSEELKRGITIKLGYADTIIKDKRYVSFVDAPGHEMLMATMLSGAAMMDAAILVIAANEGIQPQTREHLMALQAKNMENIIIVQNKIDLVGKEEALNNYKKIQEFVKGTVAEKAPVIPCSALQGVNIDKILEELIKVKIPKRETGKEPVLIVARSFDVNKPGAKISGLKGGVLGGALKQGKLKPGDEIEIKPGISEKKENKLVYETVKTKILNIFKGKYKVEEATPGGSLALETELDPVLTKADILAGTVVGLKDKLPEIKERVKIKFKLFKEVLGLSGHQKVDSIKTAEMLLLSVNTSITIGSVTKVDKDEAELHLRIPVVEFKGESIGIARNIDNHWRLIGYGEIV